MRNLLLATLLLTSVLSFELCGKVYGMDIPDTLGNEPTPKILSQNQATNNTPQVPGIVITTEPGIEKPAESRPTDPDFVPKLLITPEQVQESKRQDYPFATYTGKDAASANDLGNIPHLAIPNIPETGNLIKPSMDFAAETAFDLTVTAEALYYDDPASGTDPAPGPAETENAQIYAVGSLMDYQIGTPSFAISELFFDAESEPLLSEGELRQLFDEFDIPVTMTARVQHYIKYYTESARSTMQRWIDRSNQYMYIVKDIFRKEDVPQDLVALAFTESGFNPTAKSIASATGMWQFMASTGRAYGLEQNDWLDERMDFEKATVAAAKHLKDLYNQFNDWYLALAAYNAGSGRIASATKKHNTNDFFTIATGSTLKLETREYVPKYLAQLLIYKNMVEYGFSPPSELPLLFDTIEVKKQTNIITLGNLLGNAEEDMKLLNPELKTSLTPPVSSYTLRIPLGTKSVAEIYLVQHARELAMPSYHTVRSGENMTTISRKYNIPLNVLKQLNPKINPDRIYPGQVLVISRNGRNN